MNYSSSALKTFVGSVALVTLVGCDAAVVDAGAHDRQFEGGSCPVWQCGYNSAEVNGRAIHDLNLDGEANDDGMRVVGFLAPAGILGDYELTTEDDELVARDANGIGKDLRGVALLGATILVQDSSPLSLPLPITILNYQEIPSWAAGAAPVATYAMVYPDVDALIGQRNVCTGDLLDTLTSAVTVLGGEVYDLETKTVKPADRWLTLACAGSAAAKLRLLNYGPQSDFDGEGHPATLEQRQATLKMITADYCGDGHSYTKNGTPLTWENADGTVEATNFGSLEAVWTAKGALCLETTRLRDVDVGCALPKCSGMTLDDGEWQTRVPRSQLK